MIELNGIPHHTNFAHITVTRTGDSRHTRYRVSPDEAKQPSKISYQAIAELMTQEAIRSDKERKYGDTYED